MRLTATPGKSPAGKVVKMKLHPGNRKLGSSNVGQLRRYFEPSSIQVRAITPKIQTPFNPGQTDELCVSQPGQRIPVEQLCEPTGNEKL